MGAAMEPAKAPPRATGNRPHASRPAPPPAHPAPASQRRVPAWAVLTIAGLALALGVAITWGVMAGRGGGAAPDGDSSNASGGGGAGATSGPLAINLVSAADRGCSPDTFTPHDLRVTVSVDGKQVLQAYAEQVNDPVYAEIAEVRIPEGSARVAVIVEEAEPGGFLGLEDRFIPCDASPGAETTFTLQWDGSFQQVTAQGDGEQSAIVRLVLGAGAPPKPVAQAQAKGAHAITVSWDSHASATMHRIAGGGYGSVVRTAGAGAGSVEFTGLCDNHAYTLRVIRDAGAWSVASAAVTATTANAAPAAPSILGAARRDGRLHLEWEEETTHDIERYELHVGASASFTPSSSTRADTYEAAGSSRHFSTSFTDKTGTYVRIVAVDTGGLQAVSEAFKVGDPDRQGELTGFGSCNLA